MRLSILPVSPRNWVLLGILFALLVSVNLAAQTYSRSLLLQFVPQTEQDDFFNPQDKPAISPETAVAKALSGYPGSEAAPAVEEVVLVHLYNPQVDPPLDDRLAWAVNFDPKKLTELRIEETGGQPQFYPVVFEYVLIDAQTGDFIYGAEGGGAPIGSY